VKTLMDAPGAWYGNEVDKTGRGNLVVDVKRIAPAIGWLRRHGLTITASEAKTGYPNPDACGILLHVQRGSRGAAALAN